jgi:hypothetical protein
MNDDSSMNILPNEVIRLIADVMLNPAERARLSTCSRHLQGLLPSSLRFKITSSRGDGCLQPEFFVSPAEQPSKLFESGDNLFYGHRYYFWTYDYERDNKVFLGRHTRHGYEQDESDDLLYLYTLGLRPCHPNQTWEIVGGHDGDTVMWGEDVGLTVGGENPKPRQPDSDQRCLLSCLPASGQPSWCVLQEEWGEHEKLQLLPCQQYVPGDDVAEKAIIVHAIPEVCDEGEYLLHNPNSTMNGSVYCEGYHVIVDFHFWIEQGVMHFCSPALPFTLGIPVLETDVPQSNVSLLANLLEIKSARWGCVIYYMAVAADVSEGKTLDIQRFLRRVTDHQDHTVVVNEAKDLVYIDVRNKQVNTGTPALPCDKSAVWKFILSW